jgi:cellulose synthase/poly-beta-1,6-N-acetylglucosamine synthase-like glycosyltransferase
MNVRASTRANTRTAVIIPVYASAYLSEALDSVFTQRRQPEEVVVIDDGSPDSRTVEAAASLWPGRVRLLRQANAGAAAARNAGLAATDAEWVAFLDADDRWRPEFLARQMAFLDAHADVDLVWADASIVGDTPAVGQTFMSMCPSNGPVTLESLLAQTCTVLTSTVVVRRRLVVNAGMFDVSLRRGQDFDLWLRLVAGGARADYQREVLAMRRLHGKNLSGTRLNELERALHVFDKALNTLALTATEEAAARQRVRRLNGELARERGKARLAAGDFAGARHFLDVARGAAPNWKLTAARLGLRLAPSLLRRVYLSRGLAAVAAATFPI